MGFLISMGFAFVVFFVLIVVGRHLRRSRDGEVVGAGNVLRIIAPILLGVWIILHSSLASFHQIPAGQVGVVYEFGAIVDQVDEGFQPIPPWRSVELANVQIQKHPFAGEDQLSSFSKETQTVFIQATLNIRVKPDAIQSLYRSVGSRYFETLVKPRVSQNFKDEVVKYTTVEIAPNREPIRKAVAGRLERELHQYSIEVVDLLLDNIDFSDDFEKAIEQKQIATQKALEEEQKVAVERYRAEQAVEKAKGEGSAILAVAEKQAEANKKLSESITPTLVQYALVQKLADKISVALLPAGQNFILDSSLLKGDEKK